MEKQQARQLAKTVAWARVAAGVTALLTPSLALRLWAGPEIGRQKEGQMLARALGGRDLALGIGVLLTLRHDAPVRGWVEGGGLADTGDALATLLAFPALPRWGRWLVLLPAVGAAAAARLAAPAVD